jgi:hypothetical protein
VVEVDGAGQADLGLDAEHVGLDELRAGEAALLGDRQKGRDEGSGLVTAHRLAEIVVVQRVRRRAVEEGGIERRGLALRAEQGARPRRLGDAAGTEQVGGAGFHRAGKGHADRVDDRRPGELDRLFGNVLIAKQTDALSQALNDGLAHAAAPAIARLFDSGFAAARPAMRPKVAPETRPVPAG